MVGDINMKLILIANVVASAAAVVDAVVDVVSLVIDT